MFSRLLAVLAFVTLATPASAVTYTYTGGHYNSFPYPLENPFNSSMRVSGYIILDTPLEANTTTAFGNGLPPQWLVDFSFNTGLTTLSQAGSALFFATLTTDEYGNIFEWSVNVWSAFYFQSASTTHSLDVGQQVGGKAQASFTASAPPGSWTPVSPIPLPAGILLFGSALLGLAGYSTLVRRVRRTGTGLNATSLTASHCGGSST